jgi:hypothetical protein
MGKNAETRYAAAAAITTYFKVFIRVRFFATFYFLLP